jgi:MerR family redox-sensitive transcriptional activator SoxR
MMRRIACIVFAQRIGLSLDEVGAELAKLPENRVPERVDWARLSASWTKRIDERIAELERVRAGLTQCIGCGCLPLQQCQLANPGDRAGRRGPGPRYWIGKQTPAEIGGWPHRATSVREDSSSSTRIPT